MFRMDDGDLQKDLAGKFSAFDDEDLDDAWATAFKGGDDFGAFDADDTNFGDADFAADDTMNFGGSADFGAGASAGFRADFGDEEVDGTSPGERTEVQAPEQMVSKDVGSVVAAVDDEVVAHISAGERISEAQKQTSHSGEGTLSRINPRTLSEGEGVEEPRGVKAYRPLEPWSP